jgi:hypothetical protein
MAKDKKVDAFIDTLVDVIMGEHKPQHPALNAADKISLDFHKIMGLRWNKLFEEYKANSGCKTPGCVQCAFTYKQNMRLLKFVRETMEPHKAAYVELVNDIRAKNDAFDRLQDETQSQNREHN